MREKYNLRRKSFLMLILLATLSYLSPVYSQCTEPTAFYMLDLNNVAVGVGNGQRLFYDGYQQSHEVPKGSDRHTFFSGGFWIGGMNADDSLRLSANTFNAIGYSYLPGPLTVGNAALGIDPGLTVDEACEDFNRMFYARRNMSMQHVQYFDAVDNGSVATEFPLGYDIPNEILEYPGNGDVSLGLSEQLAPFYDRNQDGVYDPYTGDCTLFTGMIDGLACESCEALNGDMALFWIDNDMGSGDDVDGVPIGVEIQNVVYEFTSTDDINNTVFYQKKIINRGSETLTDAYISLFFDADIGCAVDDYVGCDVSRNMAYMYNGNQEDSGCGSGQGSYGANPPIAGVVMLGSPLGDMVSIGVHDTLDMSGFNSFNNSAGNYGDPDNAAEFYNLMKGNWNNGEPLTCGGTGIGGDIAYPYMYPGDSDPDMPCDTWTEYGEANQPGDRRFIMSFGPFTLDPGATKCLTFATIYSAGQGSHEENISAIQEVSDNVQNAFDGCFTDLISSVDVLEMESFVNIEFDNSSNMLSLSSERFESIAVRVIDDIGRVHVITDFNSIKTIDLSSLASGLYIVQLQDAAGLTMSEKLLKM